MTKPLDIIEPSTLQNMDKVELIRLCQLQNQANHHVAAENEKLTKRLNHRDKTILVRAARILELETKLEQS